MGVRPACKAKGDEATLRAATGTVKLVCKAKGDEATPLRAGTGDSQAHLQG